MGRGVSRGGRDHPLDILHTRPQTCASKKGSSGEPINLTTNYFALKLSSDWKLYQYQ